MFELELESEPEPGLVSEKIFITINHDLILKILTFLSQYDITRCFNFSS